MKGFTKIYPLSMHFCWFYPSLFCVDPFRRHEEIEGEERLIETDVDYDENSFLSLLRQGFADVGWRSSSYCSMENDSLTELARR